MPDQSQPWLNDAPAPSAAPAHSSAPADQPWLNDEPVAKMRHFTAKGKNGKADIPFQVPEGATDDDIHKAAAAATGDKDYLKSNVIHAGETPPDTRPTSFLQGVGEGMDNVIDHGAMALQGGVNYLGGFFGAPHLGDKIEQFGGDHLGMAASEQDATALQQREYAASPYRGSTPGKMVGTGLALAPISRIPGVATAPGLALSGAGIGAVLSDKKTAGGVAVDAGWGAAGSLVGGKVIAPAIGAAVSKVAPYAKQGVQAIGRMAGIGETAAPAAAPAASAPAVMPRVGDILLKKLAAQGHTPEEAGQMIDEARARGVPLALMDTGDETRGLASALSRKPGPSRTIVRDAVIPRQEAQLDRVQGAIRRDLGATANVRQQSEALAQQAKTDADPLYAKFRAEPARTSPELESLIATPAGQKALTRAQNIAANDRVDPNKLGFTLDAEGNVALAKNPSPQTLDYIKQGLDDVVEDNRDPVTGRLVLNTAQRAENNVRGQFVKEMDNLYPDTYKAARQAYGGPVRMASALAKGAKIGTRDSEQILAETQDMGAAELEQYRLGVRSALSKALEGKVDGADKVRTLVGTPAKRKALAQVFGGIPEFNNFLNTLADEGKAAATYGRVNAGSQTAANLADDAGANGLTGVAVNAGRRLVTGHGLPSNLYHTLSDLYDYGAGKAGEEARAQLAAGISETDPTVLKAFLDAAKSTGTQRHAGITARKVGGLAGVYATSQSSR